MSYINTVKKINSELLKLTDKYHNSPLDDATLDKIIRLTNSFNTNSNNAIQTLEARLNLIAERNEKYFENFKKNKDENFKKNSISVEKTNDKYVDIVNKIKSENEANQNKIVAIKNELAIDNEILIKSNEQKEAVIINEKNEAIKKFDFQISNASDSYDKIIEKYNQYLNEKINKETIAYQNSLKDFDKEVIDYIKEIEKKKIVYNTEKQEFLDKLSLVENNKKQKLLEQSIALNKIINTLISDRNVLIDKAKKEYQASINKSQDERLKEQQQIKADSNNIQREFVYKITALDEKENKIKQEYSEIIKKETFNHLIALKKVHKIEETKILEIYKILGSRNQKALNNSIKLIKKATSLDVLEKNKHFNKQLREITLKHYKQIEAIKHRKNLLEVEKNCRIDNNNARELAINKYYQEHNSIFEVSMNSSIKIANVKYNQKATQTKYQYDVKRLDINKDFEVSEANFKKKLEMIESDIRKADYQISSIRKLKNLLHNYEDSKFEKRINYYNVNNLLEIELNKILNEYNKRQYDFNISIAKLSSSYSIGLLRHEEYNNKAKLKLENNKYNLKMKNNTQMTGYKIYEQGIFEEYERKINSANMAYENSIITHELLSSRFKEELKAINFHIFNISILLDNLIQYIEKITSIVITIFKADLANVTSINYFLHDISTISAGFCRDLLNDYYEAINNLIYKHNEFEEKIKFKNSYNVIVHNYEISKKRLFEKKADVEASIEENKSSTVTYQDRIYSYKNQIYVEINKKLKNRKYLKSLKQGLADTKQRIKELNKIDTMLNIDLKNITIELLKLDVDYNRKIEVQKKLQYEASKTYYLLKKQINSLVQKVNNKTYNYLIILNSNKIKDYELIVSKKLDYYNGILLKLRKEIYYEANYFIYQTKIEQDKNKLLISNNHKENMNSIDQDKNKQLKQNLNQINEALNEFNTKLKWADYELKVNDIDFKNKLNEYNDNYNTQNNLIIEQKRLSLNNFYLCFNSMLDNKDELKRNFDTTLHSIDESNYSAKNSLIKRDNEFDNQNKLELNQFIKSKDDLINHLLLTIKYQSVNLNKEFNDIDSKDNHILIETKSISNFNIKQINKNEHEIKLALEEQISESNTNFQKNVVKIKKAYYLKIKKAQKEKELTIL